MTILEAYKAKEGLFGRSSNAVADAISVTLRNEFSSLRQPGGSLERTKRSFSYSLQHYRVAHHRCV